MQYKISLFVIYLEFKDYEIMHIYLYLHHVLLCSLVIKNKAKQDIDNYLSFVSGVVNNSSSVCLVEIFV